MSRPTNRFDELMGRLRQPVEGEELPPSIYDDLTNEYETLWSGSQAATTQREQEIERLKQENNTLKSKNYDLLMSVGAPPVEVDETDDEDKQPDINSLFTKKR